VRRNTVIVQELPGMQTCPLRLYICGRLAIEHAEMVIREQDFPARQSRRLWAYLVLNRRRPVSREELLDALWGDEIPDAWDTTLNGLVSRLRRLLRQVPIEQGQLGIRGEVGRYDLLLPGDTFVDHDRARMAIHTTERVLRQQAYGEALAEARVALEIATRGFLIGEEAPWISGERQRLEDIQLRALECTAEAELARGNSRLAEHEARELLRLAPLRESGYRLLMRALATGGNAAQLPLVMDLCRNALAQQAGMDPSLETTRLYEALIDG
jgi:SARP family transcriptional regulator, regulator of embCAB operon